MQIYILTILAEQMYFCFMCCHFIFIISNQSQLRSYFLITSLISYYHSEVSSFVDAAYFICASEFRCEDFLAVKTHNNANTLVQITYFLKCCFVWAETFLWIVSGFWARISFVHSYCFAIHAEDMILDLHSSVHFDYLF